MRRRRFRIWFTGAVVEVCLGGGMAAAVPLPGRSELTDGVEEIR